MATVPAVLIPKELIPPFSRKRPSAARSLKTGSPVRGSQRMRAESSEQVTIRLPAGQPSTSHSRSRWETRLTIRSESSTGDGCDVTSEDVESVSSGHCTEPSVRRESRRRQRVPRLTLPQPDCPVCCSTKKEVSLGVPVEPLPVTTTTSVPPPLTSTTKLQNSRSLHLVPPGRSRTPS